MLCFFIIVGYIWMVLSVDPVSQIEMQSTISLTLSKQRSMIFSSFLTIIVKHILGSSPLRMGEEKRDMFSRIAYNNTHTLENRISISCVKYASYKIMLKKIKESLKLDLDSLNDYTVVGYENVIDGRTDCIIFLSLWSL